MKKCTQCGNEFEPNTKKRVFCSNKCRQKNYRESVLQIIKSAKEVKAEDTIPKEDDEIAILRKIISIEREKIPNDRDTALGRAMWQKEQSNRIQELKNKIK